MFAVIYRGFIYLECEQQYRQAWQVIANYFVQHCGALGSTLHKTEQGDYLAYSRWLDQQTRDAVWGESAKTLPKAVEEAICCLKDSIDITKPHDEIAMDIVDSVVKQISPFLD